MKAIWNDTIIAESADIVTVEGNTYFPVESVKKEFLQDSNTHTVCPWKGTASYYTLKVNDKINIDAAWYYPTPSKLAKNITNRIAFWKGVEITNE
ncbi:MULTISPECIES: DUF427 domain-containing protein [unclassified Saccharicrinis]|uniref:DUF427 domain-containing protein n=1 Tax=unclassified Saccharicrinis TaxID=2646859 RepID=UPI003D3362B2